MIAVYGSRGYDVNVESLRACRELRSAGVALADRVCGDTIRHIWGEWKHGGHVAGWIESEHNDGIARFYVSHEKSEWIA